MCGTGSSILLGFVNAREVGVSSRNLVSRTFPQIVQSMLTPMLFILLQLVNNANSPGPHVRDAHAAETSRDGYMRTPTLRVDPPATLQYSRDQLVSVPPSGLDATALSYIRQLSIGYRLPKSRTHRAGRRKQNAIRTIVNSRSDTLFTPSPTTLPNCTATTGVT